MDFFGSKIFWFSLRLIQLLIAILILGLSAYGTPFTFSHTQTLPPETQPNPSPSPSPFPSPSPKLTTDKQTVINWWNETWSATSPTPLSLLLFSSLLTPPALTYLLLIPAYCSNSRWNSPGLVACVEGSMGLLWAASSITTAMYVTERVCFGRVCAVAQGAVVLGVFEW